MKLRVAITAATVAMFVCPFSATAYMPAMPGNCAHHECLDGVALNPSCSSVVASVCNAEPSCCSTAWDKWCIELAWEYGANCGTCYHSECLAGYALVNGCSSCANDVCYYDPVCCGSQIWDAQCQREAANLCGGSCDATNAAMGMSALADFFDDSSFDTSLWTKVFESGTEGQITETSTLNLIPGWPYPLQTGVFKSGVKSNLWYFGAKFNPLTFNYDYFDVEAGIHVDERISFANGNQLVFEVKDDGTGSSAYGMSFVMMNDSNGDPILKMMKTVAGVTSVVDYYSMTAANWAGGVPYWWKIRVAPSGSSILFEVSVDGMTWMTGAWFTLSEIGSHLSSMRAWMVIQTTGDPALQDVARFSDFNLRPTGPYSH